MKSKPGHTAVAPWQAVGEADVSSVAPEPALFRLDRFFYLSVDLLCIARTDGYFKRLNPAWTKTLGWSEAELCAKPYLAFVHPDDVAGTVRNLERHRQRHAVRQFENRYRCRDGSYRWLQWTSIAEADGAIYGIARDVTERRRMERALEQSEQRFRDFAECASDWLWETGPDLRFTYLSARATVATGFPVDAVIGRTREELARDATDTEAWRRHSDAVRERRPFRDFVYSLSNVDGSARWVSTSGQPRFDPTGRFLGYRGTGSDITRRKQAEDARRHAEQALRESHDRLEQRVQERTAELRAREETLRESEQRFRHLAEAASDWFWEIDADLRFTWVSENVAAETGLPRSAIVGRTRAAIGLTEDNPVLWREHLETLRARKPFRDFEFRRNGPKGWRWVRASGVPVFDEAGAFLGYRGTSRDVTAEVEAARAASTVTERFLHAIEKLPDGLSLWDAEDRMVLCNSVYRRMAGRSGELMKPGFTFEECVRHGLECGEIEDAAGREEQWLADRMRRHRAASGEFEIFRNSRWLLIRESRSPDGGILVTATDITGLKLREAELDRARGEAERANRAKSEFLANMSHELRTPLNAIIGFSETIMGELFGPVGKPIYAEYGKDIHESGLHLLKLINELLDLSKIEAGKFELRDDVLRLDKLMPKILRLIEPAAAKKGLRLEVALQPGLPRLRADELAVKQMLLNLLSNAVKFTPPDGLVTLRAGAGAGAEGISLAVQDTGIGIEAGNIARVLRPFGQERNPLLEAAEGTGLGLPIVKSLIELHGGRLELESAPGVGTIVALHFPPERALAIP